MSEKLNIYHCFYKGKKVEIVAPTAYEAQLFGAKKLKAKKSWKVSVVLVAKDGKQVVHKPDF